MSTGAACCCCDRRKQGWTEANDQQSPVQAYVWVTHLTVNLARRQVVVASESNVKKALIITQIQVSLQSMHARTH